MSEVSATTNSGAWIIDPENESLTSSRSSAEADAGETTRHNSKKVTIPIAKNGLILRPPNDCRRNRTQDFNLIETSASRSQSQVYESHEVVRSSRQFDLLLVHGALAANILANLGVHEIEAGSLFGGHRAANDSAREEIDHRCDVLASERWSEATGWDDTLAWGVTNSKYQAEFSGDDPVR